LVNAIPTITTKGSVIQASCLSLEVPPANG